MSVVNFLHIEADTIAENPISIPFRWDILDNIPDNETPGNDITITPLSVQTWFRIKPYIIELIASGDFDNLIHQSIKGPSIQVIELMDKYDHLILEIIYLGIHNKPGELPDWYKKALVDNCSWSDLFILLNAILFRIGQQTFIKSITTVMNVSPMMETEIIAAQKNLESWTIAPQVQ